MRKLICTKFFLMYIAVMVSVSVAFAAAVQNAPSVGPIEQLTVQSSNNGLVVPISVIVGGLITIIAFFGRQEIRKLNQHLEDCELKNLAHAKLEGKIDGMVERLEDFCNRLDEIREDVKGIQKPPRRG